MATWGLKPIYLKKDCIKDAKKLTELYTYTVFNTKAKKTEQILECNINS